jgi:hypothetical protein
LPHAPNVVQRDAHSMCIARDLSYQSAIKCVLLSGSGMAKALSAPCLRLAVICKRAIAACSACVPVCSRRTNRAERKARIAFVAIGLIHGPADCLISLQSGADIEAHDAIGVASLRTVRRTSLRNS